MRDTKFLITDFLALFKAVTYVDTETRLDNNDQLQL